MSTFPSLIPNSINFDFGAPQISEYSSFGVGPIRFRHTNFINGQTFSLKYQGLDQASIELLRTHYSHNSGTAGEFSVPISVVGGVNAVNSTSIYRYTTTPTEEHIGFQRYNVTVSIRAIEGVLIQFVLVGEPAQLGGLVAFDNYVFSGTAPFILDAVDADPALPISLILEAGGASL
tara:strand:+ start:1129 stop:1656 length:528 start_codon:yes stop_codon:yes gene_type:complete